MPVSSIRTTAPAASARHRHRGQRTTRTLLLLALGASAAWGATQTPVDLDSIVELHGFASQGYLKSSDNNYLGDTQGGDFDFNEFGLNASRQVTSNMRVGAQLFARSLGRLGGDQVTLDWAYGDYRWRDWLGVRIGRIREPGGLYNETRDLDLARVSVLLPQSVYNEVYRDVLSDYNGGCVYGHLRAGSAGTVDYQLFGGGTVVASDSSLALALEDSGSLTVTSIRSRDVLGGQALWEPPLQGLRTGVTWVHFDYTVTGATTAVPGVVASEPVQEKARTDLVFVSAQYTRERWQLTAEALRTNAVFNDQFGHASLVVNQFGWYIDGEYYLRQDVALDAYGSTYQANQPTHAATGVANYQRDEAVGVRWDINDWWLAKAEGHAIQGTGQLSQQENLGPGFPFGSKQAHDHWWLLAVKSTLTF